jgi:phosphate starvation-inducible PhoH-like protein
MHCFKFLLFCYLSLTQSFSPIYNPKTPKQQKYINFIENDKYPIVIGEGPAGTGKTLLACQTGIKLLQEKRCKKIILTRPIVTADEALGFLPGDLFDKMKPCILPLMDVFDLYYTKEKIEYMMNNNIIEIVPLAYMRGRTFNDCYIIADEMQNSTPNQMKMLLTRIGHNSKMIITGDLEQNDLDKKNNGLAQLLYLLDIKYSEKYELYNEGFGLVKFDNDSICRNKFISVILDLYK